MSGEKETIAPAVSEPQSVWNGVMVLPSRTGSVTHLSLVSRKANRNSFQAKTKVNMAVTAIPPRHIGTMKRNRIFSGPAPSAEAASSIERGDLGEEAQKHPDGEGQRKREVDQQHAEVVVEQAAPVEDEIERHHDGDRR